MIQPALSALLTDGEVEYLCELITPKEIKLYFQKNPAAFVELQSGFRAKALTDQRAIDLIVRNRHRNFVATFLKSFVETCHKRIHDKMISLQENGATTDVAMIQALAGSHVFSCGYARPGGCIQGLGVRGNASCKIPRPTPAPGLRSSRCRQRHGGQS